MILVIATVRLHAGKAPEYEAAVARIMPEVRAATPGIVFYHAGRCREEADTYRVVEAYADQKALDRHVCSASLQASLSTLTPLVSGIEIRFHETVA